ncbi:MAG: hypothetical protein ABSA23_08735 [Anaerolineales bacterium]|jgi:hypothetical protein
MSVLNKIAFFQNRRDEIPNQEMARELAQTRSQADIQEIATNLWNKVPNIQSDCLKVLYELGYLAPELIADRVDDFLKFLRHPNNRMVWGGRIALSTVADSKAAEIFPHVDEIVQVMKMGSVITMDNGIKALALVASQKGEYRKAIFPILLDHLKTCRPKEVPQHAEKSLPATTVDNKSDLILVLEKRFEEMTASQAAQLKKIIKVAEKR